MSTTFNGATYKCKHQNEMYIMYENIIKAFTSQCYDYWSIITTIKVTPHIHYYIYVLDIYSELYMLVRVVCSWFVLGVFEVCVVIT